MTVQELLSSLSAYPIPATYIQAVGTEAGIDTSADVHSLDSRTLNWMKSRAYFYLATAPNVSEGGVSISLTAADKRYFLNLAKRFMALAGEGEMGIYPAASYGYKGENL